MSLPKDLFEDSYAIPRALFTTNLDKSEIFLYARMWDDSEFNERKYGFYCPTRARLSAYVGSDREDTATAIVARLIKKGYVVDTGKKYMNRPIYKIVDFRTIPGAIIKPRIEERTSTKAEIIIPPVVKTEELEVVELEILDTANRKPIDSQSENDFQPIGNRAHSLYNSTSNLYNKEIENTIGIESNFITPHLKEKKEVLFKSNSTKYVEEKLKEINESPSSESVPLIVTPSLADFNQAEFHKWLREYLISHPGCDRDVNKLRAIYSSLTNNAP